MLLIFHQDATLVIPPKKGSKKGFEPRFQRKKKFDPRPLGSKNAKNPI